MAELRFDNKVVIVTGAGNGLGRDYALEFARRGAKIVVNDLGGSHNGLGYSSKAADLVVDEIKKAGGQAVGNYDSVEFGEKIVKTAVDAFGKVDILINNAGILRDISLLKMKPQDWDLIMAVHMKGTFSCTKAAWPIMREQGFGRIINTSSGAGLYGAFGQTNYSAAKLGIHGFTQAVAKEGEKRNIRCNSIAPVAASRMTATVMPEEALKTMDPKYIVPLVVYLSHESCEETGSVFELCAGFIAKLRWQRSEGSFFNLPFSAEQVKTQFAEVCDFGRNNEYPTGANDIFPKVTENLERQKNQKVPMKTSSSIQNAKDFGKIDQKTDLKSEKIFDMMKVYLDRGEGKKQTEKVQAVFNFDIMKQKGAPVSKSWIIDLKNGQGAVKWGKLNNADASFTMTDDDFEAVCLGTLNPQNAFLQGKMKIKGNMRKATMFTPELFPAPTAENMAKYQKSNL